MEKQKNCTRNKVGGEAVLEGVMMKAGERCATACRLADGSISVTTQRFTSVRKRHRFLNIPILRGVVNFIEMMILSLRSLNISADALGLNDEEEEGRFEKFMKKHFGLRLTDFVMILAAILGVALAVFLFIYIPSLIAKGVFHLFPALPLFLFSLIEGVVKIAVFVGYIALVSLLPDIRHTFEYHGAEHKSIALYESGNDLTPENAKAYTRFHPRCGTSFLFVMILLGILIGLLLPTGIPAVLRAGLRLLLLPFVMGLGYEFIMYAGRHDNLLVRILSAPGLLMQRLTTREPSEKQLEVAITALKFALLAEFPDFDTSVYKVTDADSGDVTEPKMPGGDTTDADSGDTTEPKKPDTDTTDTAAHCQGEANVCPPALASEESDNTVTLGALFAPPADGEDTP